jgi:non-specific serine/threonine protein kinase
VESLDGIPLAIELAAARLEVLSVSEMQARLADRFRLLRTQEQTLRATVDWSYRLLPRGDQNFLRKLSIFVGGFDLAAAEAVAASPAGEDALDSLQRLVDRSLVLVDQSADKTRYLLLDTIRDYCLEQLAHDTSGDVQRRHAEYYAGVVVDVCNRARDADFVLQIWDEIDPDEGNLLAALQWSAARDRASLVQLAGASWYWFHIRGRWNAWSYWTADALRTPHPESPELTLALEGAAAAQSYLGSTEEGVRLQARALRMAAVHQPNAVATMTGNLGVMHRINGDLPAARTALRDAVKLHQAAGRRARAASALANLAAVEIDAGDLDRAWDLDQEALREAPIGIPHVLLFRLRFGMAYIAGRRGQVAEARKQLRASLAVADPPINPGNAGQLFLAAAALALAESRAAEAAVMLGAWDRLQASTGGSRGLSVGDGTLLPAVTAALSPDAYELAHNEGMALDQTAAIERVRSLLQPQPSAARKGLLSGREMEVVELVAEGLTNKQIGARLFIAEKSVEGHLDRIANKLGFRSRGRIGAWVTEQRAAPN